MTDFKTELAGVAHAVEQALAQHLPRPAGDHAVVTKAMRYAALGGGKRLRPFLLVEAARMLGGDTDGALLAGCALECIHVYSLIHDDLPCMDDDDLRRGKPTVHKAYDEAIAVLAGDGLLTHAFALMADARVHPDPALRLRLVAELAAASGTDGMIGGQVTDITVAEDARDTALITRLQAMKTGALIRFATKAGGLIAAAEPHDLMALDRYASALGLAFQIQDDILDVEGDMETVGKAVGKDANLGKATFVSTLGLDGAKQKARELGQTAGAALAPYGEKAQTLLGTVDFVLERRH
ncbi:polyprenyl synthetase family protein [Algimonas porphyrae]|uniref:Farnesyl-diphosphate synthase n=1 Tax=Algimonas porphyrae TaxID=1128113 RepID=A0ABQ5UX24_9PROT|nr:farnesyl diphosphate synthase [Algimonas porphyrae]GLQ19863.1 farnesyl-diphosphate synthase [Algimonas porphyrae]